jgi:hypothetical protein
MPNDVADKRRPIATNLRATIIHLLKNLFNRTTLQSNNARKNKASNYKNAKCENSLPRKSLMLGCPP